MYSSETKKPDPNDPNYIFPESISILFLKIIDQAIRDIVAYHKCTKNKEFYYFITAYCFIFDDTCYIPWGERELCFRDMADLVEVDYIWAREEILRRMDARF